MDSSLPLIALLVVEAGEVAEFSELPESRCLDCASVDAGGIDVKDDDITRY